MLTALYGHKGMAAEGAMELEFFVKASGPGRKHLPAGLTKALSFGAVIAVNVVDGGVAAGTAKARRKITILPAPDWRQVTAVVASLVFHPEMLPVFFLNGNNDRQLIRFEFLVFWGSGVIESPLFKGNIFADKRNQPAVLAIKVIHDRNQILYNVHEQYHLFLMLVWRLTLYTKVGGIALFICKSSKIKGYTQLYRGYTLHYVTGREETFMKKNKVVRVDGVRVVVPIRKDHNRPLLPPKQVFGRKTDYNRRAAKQQLRRDLASF